MDATARNSKMAASVKSRSKKATKQPQVNLKSKKKAVSGYFRRATFLGLAVLVLAIAIAVVLNSYASWVQFLPEELRRNMLRLFPSSKQPFRFKQEPIPEFNISRGIDRRSRLSLEEFTDLYDGKWPVLITDALDNWPAMKKWNKQYFMQNFGDKVVAFKGVTGTLDKRQGLAAPLGVFLQHLHESSPTSWTYAEDEVFLVRNPELRNDIKTPIYLKEDFFSLLPTHVRPWNAMLLWGTKFSRSTLHIDPYNWTGTNAVIRGRKLWKLYPPGQDHLLYIPSGKKSGFPLDCPKYQSLVDTYDYNAKKYPLLKHAKAVEFEQLPGEMLIIPTGWFHQAYNAEETLAISSQIMNSQNHRWNVFRQVLEEIIKGKNVNEDNIPADFDSHPPKEKMELLISLFPESIIEHGKSVNKDIMKQLDQVKK